MRIVSPSVFLCCLIFITVAKPEVRFHFIAVGHGDATLIEENGQGLALVDAGRPERASTLITYLDSLNIHRLDHLFITHNHDDHIGGIPAILDSCEVGVVHITGMVDTWETAATLTRYLQTGYWQVDTVDAGEVIPISDDLIIQVLSPSSCEVAGKTVENNSNSMVLIVTHGRIKVLLAADINQERETRLLQQYGADLKSNALKVPHHGSAAGYCSEFIQTVHPEVAIICIGPNNLGYPASATIDQLKKKIPFVFRTDENGTVVLSSDGLHLKVIKPEIAKP